MWPNWKQRAEEILQYAVLFDRERYFGTAKWLRYLAVQIGEKKPIANLEADLEEARATFKAEFSAGGSSYRQLYAAVEPAMNFMVTRPPAQQLKFLPLFTDLAHNAQNLTPIDEAFKNFPLGRVRFYGMCLMYLMNAEGIFDQAIRLLYGLVREAGKNPITVKKLNIMSVNNIKNHLLKMKAPTALFEGWVDGHVRNAIAHCRFDYDEGSKLMNFQDVDPQTGKETYRASFLIEQFGELYTKLDNVWHVISHLIYMTRVIFLVMLRDVPDAGK